jgi:hypothetical protein
LLRLSISALTVRVPELTIDDIFIIDDLLEALPVAGNATGNASGYEWQQRTIKGSTLLLLGQ